MPSRVEAVDHVYDVLDVPDRFDQLRYERRVRFGTSAVSSLPAKATTPLSTVTREPPSAPVITGVGAVDALTTLVRGQKLPVFSTAGLPHLELAAQIAAQSTVGGESFSVVFAGMGLTHPDAAVVRDALEERSAAGELVLLLNTADDPDPSPSCRSGTGWVMSPAAW